MPRNIISRLRKQYYYNLTDQYIEVRENRK